MTAHRMSDEIRVGPSISVVISTYSGDRWEGLLAAVESVQRQTLCPQEIVVVVDHNQLLLERVQSLPDLVAIANREPRGLSGARNTGVAASRGDVIAFIDDDAVADPDWLELLAASYADPNLLGIGGAVEPAWVDGRPAWFPEEFDWVVGCTFRGMPRKRTRVSKLIGCNMSFRRQVFTVVGGFRSDMGRIGGIPLAGEETEFCIRASQRWPQCCWVYEPRARVRHTVPAQRASIHYFRSRCFGEGLSKARIARLAGHGDGLAAERAYLRRTLPLGIATELGDAVSHRELSSLARAAAIVAGLTITGAGYLSGAVARCDASRLPRRTHPRSITAYIASKVGKRTVEHATDLNTR